MTELHPQARALLEAVAARDEPPIEGLGVEEARRRALADLALAGKPVPVARVRDVDADDVPLRTYTPPGSPPFPGIAFIHGGGWVTGSRDLADPQCRALARACQAVVLSIEYRLAPEHPYPAGLRDCHSAMTWAVAHADELGLEPSRLVVAGDSAGGNLATASCLLARDSGGPSIAGQLLIYPVVDRSADTRSWEAFGRDHWLTRSEMEWYWEQYLHRASDAQEPHVSVLRCADLTGLPPALVYTAGCDPLRDEGEAYASRLVAAGVPTYGRRFTGQLHGFFSCASVVDAASELVRDASIWLTALWADQ